MHIMPTTAIQKKTSNTPALPKKKQRRISWKVFQKQYLTLEDEYKYEWLDGVVEKTKRTMDYSQFFIQKNLLGFLEQLRISKKVNGWLIAEGDAFFNGHHRRPDIAYFTDEQVEEARKGGKPVPQFVIEVISNYDALKKVHEKMEDYFSAGVPVIWHILPDLKQVHVYHGKEMIIHTGEEICSAAPVLPDFALAVNEVFK